MTWHASVVTLFPDMFPGPLSASLAGKAREQNLWNLSTVDMRDFGIGVHRSVDDTVYGGGCGMILRPDVVHQSLKKACALHPSKTPTLIYLTPRGTPLKQSFLRQLASNKEGCIALCGRYEGVDERVIEFWRKTHNLIEVSIGDYILSGGEMAALTLLDGCIRLLPQVVSKQASLDEESFELDLLEFSQYTRPMVWSDLGVPEMSVPEVLLSGHHKNISEWRHANSLDLTQKRRPDMYALYRQKTVNS